MKWLFMIFRLRALQRLYRTHDSRAEAWRRVMIKNMASSIDSSFALDKMKKEIEYMQQIESLIKLLQ